MASHPRLIERPIVVSGHLTCPGYPPASRDRVELMLRLKANYLWPAMWGKAFADDDPSAG